MSPDVYDGLVVYVEAATDVRPQITKAQTVTG